MKTLFWLYDRKSRRRPERTVEWFSTASHCHSLSEFQYITNTQTAQGIQRRKEASGDGFCDREKETEELLGDIRSCHNVIIFSQRRYGKTSLIKKGLNMTIDAEGKPEFTFGLEGGRDPVMDIEDVLEYVSDSLWEISSGDSAITDENLNKAIGLTLSRASPSYESVWELLPIRHRQALIALANLSPDDKLFSGAVVQKYGLASAPTFRKALKRLVEKGLADRNQHKYSITDVFFKKWIQMNFAVK